VRIALLDGDTLVYHAGREAEQVTDWGDGVWSRWAEEKEGAAVLDSIIERIREGMNADRVVVALSDYDNPNWRLSVLPSYKGHRDADPTKITRRPILWAYLRRYFHEKYETWQRPGLEGDDVLGILATHPTIMGKGSERVVVSIDKDMKTLPGYHCDFTRAATAFGWEVNEVTRAQADYFHLYQTLIGDSTDGYKGCPGVGPKGAEKILVQCMPSPHVFHVDAAWKLVVEAYEKAGLTEADALVQSRVARICRASDYDFVNKEVKLWTPPS
jgi:DNA polymerase-1